MGNSAREIRRPIDATVAGYIGVDIAPGFPHRRGSGSPSDLFRPGKLVQTEGLHFSLGGVVPNTGLALQRFAKRVALLGLVGRDLLGDWVIAQLRARGVASGIGRTDRAATAYGIVLAPPGLDRMFLEDPGCNDIFSAAQIDFPGVARSRLFHFGYPTLMRGLFARNGAELQSIFRRVHRLGVATSLDVTLPDPDSPAGKIDWRRFLATVLPQVDLFLPSIEEILCMLEPAMYRRLRSRAHGGDILDIVAPDVFDRLGDRILEYGVPIVMIKAGHRGAYVRTGDLGRLLETTSLTLDPEVWSHRTRWVPAFPVERRRMENACGAGDCAVAGFLAAVLDGANLETAGHLAMLAGRDNLYGVDALSGLRDWKSMTRELGSNRARRRIV